MDSEPRKKSNCNASSAMGALIPIGFDDLVHDVVDDWPATIASLSIQEGVRRLSYRVFPHCGRRLRRAYIDRDVFLKALSEGVTSN